MSANSILLASFTATTVMTVFLETMRRLGWASSDWLRVFGNLVTHSPRHSFGVGLMIQYLVGGIFTFLYYHLAALAPISHVGETIVLLGFLGSLHGMAAGVMFTALVDKPKSPPQFARQGFGTFVSVVMGHAIFGLTLGFLFGSSLVPDSLANQNLVVPLREFMGFTLVASVLLGAPAIGLLLVCIPWLQLRRQSQSSEAPAGNAAFYPVPLPMKLKSSEAKGSAEPPSRRVS